MPVEEAQYATVRKADNIESRDYEAFILAETSLQGTLMMPFVESGKRATPFIE